MTTRTKTAANDSTTTPSASALARDVAVVLSELAPWTAPRNSLAAHDGQWRATLRREADAAEIAVWIFGRGADARVEFRARWPKFQNGQGYSPSRPLSITCAADRGPEALAREIARRLLVVFDPAYREALAYVRRRDVAANEALRAASRIAVVVGGTVPQQDSYRQQRAGESVELLGGPACVRRLQVRPGTTGHEVRIGFELNDLDEATALRVLSLLLESERSEASGTSRVVDGDAS